MHVPIAILVVIAVIILGLSGIIVLLMVGISNKFTGYSMAFEAISEDYLKAKDALKKQDEDHQWQLLIMKSNLGDDEAIMEQMEKDLEVSHKLYEMRMGEIDQLKAQKQTLTRQYVSMSNEYAWFRSLIRELDAEKCARAEATIRLKKREAPIEEIGNVQG